MHRQQTQKNSKKNNMQADRYRTALEKLQLSWMKKTLTLSALGFASYRFFYSRIESGKSPLIESFNGRNLGILLVSLGLLGLLQATIQHMRKYAKLRIQHEHVGYSVALVQSFLLLMLFGFLLLAILLKA